jgi:hypothetical protein
MLQQLRAAADAESVFALLQESRVHPSGTRT